VYDTRGRSTARCDAAWRFVGLRRGSCSCAQAPELLVMRASLKTSRDKPGSFLRAIAPNTVTCATPQLQPEKTREVSQQPFLAQKKNVLCLLLVRHSFHPFCGRLSFCHGPICSMSGSLELGQRTRCPGFFRSPNKVFVFGPIQNCDWEYKILLLSLPLCVQRSYRAPRICCIAPICTQQLMQCASSLSSWCLASSSWYAAAISRKRASAALLSSSGVSGLSGCLSGCHCSASLPRHGARSRDGARDGARSGGARD